MSSWHFSWNGKCLDGKFPRDTTYQLESIRAENSKVEWHMSAMATVQVAYITEQI